MNEAATILPNIRVCPIRLLPGEDLMVRLQHTAASQKISAGWIMSAVGSLTDFSIRYANQPQAAQASGHFEIIALNGTVSLSGCHIHIMLADEIGQVKAGHASTGCIIYTTAEIIIGYTNQFTFDRVEDSTTGWKELTIKDNFTL